MKYDHKKRKRNHSIITIAGILLVMGIAVLLAINAEQDSGPAPEEYTAENERSAADGSSAARPAAQIPIRPPARESDENPDDDPAADYTSDDPPADPPNSAPDDPPDEEIISAPAGDPFYEAAMPILVNWENFIPEGFNPDLVPIGNGFYLNRRAAEAWSAMRAAAAQDGINLRVISAFRSHETQERNFNNMMAQHIAAGRSQEDAHARTAAYIAVPGTSEHQLGLAVDINEINNAFGDTREFAWLIENGAEFGFILRYPRDTTHITRINYEPWHFRYVGSNHARIIMDMNIVLEQYLEMFG